MSKINRRRGDEDFPTVVESEACESVDESRGDFSPHEVSNEPDEHDAAESASQGGPLQPTTLPPQATGPASSPESMPPPAGEKPASVSPRAAVVRSHPIDFRSRAESCPKAILDLHEKQASAYKGHPAEYADYMQTMVPCQLITDLKGRIGVKCEFNFRRSQVVTLPRWFATTFPAAIVIKE